MYWQNQDYRIQCTPEANWRIQLIYCHKRNNDTYMSFPNFCNAYNLWLLNTDKIYHPSCEYALGSGLNFSLSKRLVKQIFHSLLRALEKLVALMKQLKGLMLIWLHLQTARYLQRVNQKQTISLLMTYSRTLNSQGYNRYTQTNK